MYTRHLAIIAVAGLAAMSTACRNRPVVPAPPAPPEITADPTPAPVNDDAARAAAEARERAERDRLETERLAAERRRIMEVSIYFDLDRSDLTADARSTLDAKLGVLTTNPGMRIRIAGHTDERGSDEYNIALGQRRAAAAKRYLTQRGIDASRIEVISFGEEQPVCTQSDETCWSQNRRDEFQVTDAAWPDPDR